MDEIRLRVITDAAAVKGEGGPMHGFERPICDPDVYRPTLHMKALGGNTRMLGVHKRCRMSATCSAGVLSSSHETAHVFSTSPVTKFYSDGNGLSPGAKSITGTPDRHAQN